MAARYFNKSDIWYTDADYLKNPTLASFNRLLAGRVTHYMATKQYLWVLKNIPWLAKTMVFEYICETSIMNLKFRVFSFYIS
jgi:hypothetical protein